MASILKNTYIKMCILMSLVLLVVGLFLSFYDLGFEINNVIFLQLRLPRVLLALAVGAGLSVSGLVLQSTMNNPLVDPFTLGLASAASFGVALESYFKNTYSMGTAAWAFGATLVAIGLFFILMRNRFHYTAEVLLFGVVSGFLYSAVSTVVLVYVDPVSWSQNSVWLLGSLSRLTLEDAGIVLFVVVVVIGIIGTFAKALDLLAVNELTARVSGLDVEYIRKILFILSALLTAIVVAASGVIGFVGLIVPHVIKRGAIVGHKALIWLTALAGATFLLVCDQTSRIVFSPYEMPIGVLVALIGAPMFIRILRRRY